VKQRQSLTVPSVPMAMGPMNVLFASVTRVDWARDANAHWRTTVHLMMSTASQNLAAQSAMEEETVCVDSAPVTQTSLVRCGENSVNVTISPACASKGLCALVSSYKSITVKICLV